MTSGFFSTSSASTSVFASSAADDKWSSKTTSQGGVDDQTQDFDDVLDKQVSSSHPEKSGEKKNDARLHEKSKQQATDDTGEAPASSPAQTGEAVVTIPVVDTSEILIPQAIERFEEGTSAVEGDSPDPGKLLDAAGEGDEKISPDSDALPVASTTTAQGQIILEQGGIVQPVKTENPTKPEFEKKLEKALNAIESSAPSEEVADSPFISFSTGDEVRSFVNNSASNEEAPTIESSDSNPKDIAKTGDNSNQSQTSHASSAQNRLHDGQWESLTKEPVSRSTASQMISKVVNLSDSALPRRVEISMQAPDGAVVRIYLQESGGNVRAQLSTNDTDTLKWLNQQIPVLKDSQLQDNIRWLPPQLESQDQGNQRNFLNQQNQQGERENQDTENPDKSEVLDFAKILEKPL